MKRDTAQLGEVLKNILEDGEEEISRRRPRQGVTFRRWDFVWTVSALWCCAWLCFMYAGAVLAGLSWAFWLPLLLMLIFCSYILVGRFLCSAWERSRTWYVLTDRRLLICIMWPWKRVVAHDLHALTHITLSKSAKGHGLVGLDANTPWSFSQGHVWLPGRTSDILEIEGDAEQFRDTLQEMHRKAVERRTEERIAGKS